MTTDAPSFTIAGKWDFCFCHFGEIPEGEKVFQRDNTTVCEQCDPLYNLRRVAHAGGVTSRRAR